VIQLRQAQGSTSNKLMVTDRKGQVVYATSALATMLGYTPPNMMHRMNVADLMNPPFSLFHAAWLQASSLILNFFGHRACG
jgi:PAS domain-containing protein